MVSTVKQAMWIDFDVKWTINNVQEVEEFF